MQHNDGINDPVTNRVYLVAEHLSRENAYGVLLRELGVYKEERFPA